MLSVGIVIVGFWMYIVFCGGVDVFLVMGSCFIFELGKFGGYNGCKF